MIIFDLEGTLADPSHRQHFIEKPWDCCNKCYNMLIQGGEAMQCKCGRNPFTWEENWAAFFGACDKDKPIEPVIEILDGVYQNTVNFWKDVQIWSGRCESMREKTLKWLEENILWDQLGSKITLKMRPIGDVTPEHKLKELWLEETYEETTWGRKTPIEYVFESKPLVTLMWRKHGVFVFNCFQNDEIF